MGQSFQDLEQLLWLISHQLLNQRAELQKLREMVRSAEAAPRRRDQEQINPALVAPPYGNDLRA
jgi:hypothetical protein